MESGMFVIKPTPVVYADILPQRCTVGTVVEAPWRQAEISPLAIGGRTLFDANSVDYRVETSEHQQNLMPFTSEIHIYNIGTITGWSR